MIFKLYQLRTACSLAACGLATFSLAVARAEDTKIGTPATDETHHLLKGEVNLKNHEWQTNFRFDYASETFEDSGIELRQRTFGITPSISYGLTNTLELSASLPFFYISDEQPSSTRTGSFGSAAGSDTALGNGSLSLAWKAIAETEKHVGLNLSVAGLTPSGSSSYAFLDRGTAGNPLIANLRSGGVDHWGGSLGALVTQHRDPVLLYAGANLLLWAPRNVSINTTDSSSVHHEFHPEKARVKLGPDFDLYFGFVFRINESVSFDFRYQLSLESAPDVSIADVQTLSAEQHILTFGIPIGLGDKGWQLEPAVSFGISGTRSISSVGVQFTRAF